eukprot:9477493-Pyramimonas_sp.AAC.2
MKECGCSRLRGSDRQTQTEEEAQDTEHGRQAHATTDRKKYDHASQQTIRSPSPLTAWARAFDIALHRRSTPISGWLDEIDGEID